MDKFCESYEKAIEDAGGIDLQILGIGRSGHVAFNEPGSPEDSKTRSVYLDRITRLDASDGFYGLKNVPTRAITMGVGSILSAKRILLLCFGEGKAEIIAKAIEGPRTELVAASLLQKHSNVTALLDLSAAAELTYYNMPWSLASKDSTLNITYDKQLIKKAVVWLSKTCKKPILLLTDIDYYDHHLNALLEQCGSAESVNLFVFQSIQDAISGWPAGKRKKPTTRALKVFDHPTLDKKILYDADLSYHKKVAVFSPHPDDDIISMGGTLIRLCEQGNEVHTIYQTNGSVAVWDDDVLRITELTEKFAEYFDISPAEVKEKSNKIREFFKTKSSMNGFKDDFDGINIKRMIRETEAIDASIHAGVKRENVHFLNLPFYQTGQIEKKTSNQDDIDIVKSFLNQLQPELLFAAGDLTDPHGTHRKCTRIVLSALEQLENENQTWVKNCTIYLYRGAWQEWEIERANLIVPMSPTEVNFKRLCIFKHQSQKDLALFPGSDPREFWQRAEDRNKGTAELLRNLGFASFAAAEAFVLYDKSMNI
ncbi:Glucosamine-6-phosphate isomerase [Entamoeba marina]